MTGEEGKPGTERRYQQLIRDAERGGYHLNPDVAFTKALVEGLLTNKERFGYEACPCRLAFGSRDEDRDIICPCDYRDADLTQIGACYCGLYLSGELVREGRPAPVVPERRPPRSERKTTPDTPGTISGGLPYPVWRCRVCGYLAARDTPPEVCPVCKAGSDRFEIFIR
jgi:ferredoxin-thioredoxin reductase catalytic subunit